MKIWIGTSGWAYKHWRHDFYPNGLKPAAWLDHYAKFLKSVEVNNSFYALPREQSLRGWQQATPPHFLFSIKAWRVITHYQKLNNCTEHLTKLFKLLNNLDHKLGPILFQLPPNFRKNLARLESFIRDLPKNYRYSFEFRHSSWFSEDVYDLLRQNNMALCLFELADMPAPPLVVTADFIYIRLHGPDAKYRGNYTDAELNQWKEWLLVQGKDCYVYFDNTDYKTYAIQNAITLHNMLKHALNFG